MQGSEQGQLTMNMDFQPDLTLATRASTIWDTHLPVLKQPVGRHSAEAQR